MTTTTTAKKKLMFLACGSFSPPTPMHLRLFGKGIDFVIGSSSKQTENRIIGKEAKSERAIGEKQQHICSRHTLVKLNQ